MKRALIALPAVIVILLAIIFVAPGFVDWNSYKPEVQKRVKDMSGLELALGGDVRFSLLPFPHLSIEDVVLNAPEGSRNKTILSLGNIDVNVAFGPLLKGEIQVDSITIVKPLMNIEVLENGKINVLTPEIESLMAKGGDHEGSAELPAVSLEKIWVKDGVFSYYDHRNKSETIIRNINTEITAKSLLGPYKAEGTLLYAAKDVRFDLQSEAFDPITKTLSSKLNLTLGPDNIKLFYAGALNFSEGFGAQGQIRITGENLAKTFEAYHMQGVGVGAVPFEIKGLLTADAQKADLKDLGLALGQDAFIGSFDAEISPLTYNVALKSAQPFDIKNIYPAMQMFKKGAVNLSAHGDLDKISLNKSSFALDGNSMNVSGRYDLKTKAGHPSLIIDIETASLDYDGLSQSLPKSSGAKTEPLEQYLKKSIPDLDIELSFLSKTLRFQNKDLKNVTAKLALQGQHLKITNLSVENYDQSDISVTGSIEDMSALSGIMLNIGVISKDIKEFASSAGLETSSWPQSLGKSVLKAKLSGTSDQLDVTTNILAMNGEIIAQGLIKSPLGTPSLSNLALQIKHPNMAEAIKLYTGAPVQDKNWVGPLDFYTKVNQIGKSYKLEAMKGNLAGISVQGDAVLDFTNQKPLISGNLEFGKIVMNTIVNKKGGTPQGGERWSKEPIATQGLHALDANLTLSASSIDYGPWPLQKPKMQMTLKDGTLEISKLDAGLFDGKISLTSKMSVAKQERQPLHIEGQSKLEDVSVGKLVKALSGTQLITAGGRVSVDAQINTSGISPAALVYDLGGKGTVTGQDIVLEGVDVTRFARALSDESKPGDTVLGLWKGSTKGGRTEFETLDGNFMISEGIVTIEKLDLDGKQAAIQTTGKVNLPRWTLDTKHKIIVRNRDDVPPFDMSFSGSLDNPSQTFGQGVLNDYLSRKVSRKVNQKFEKLLSEKLGIPTNDNGNPQPANIEPAEGESAQQQEQPQSIEDIKPEDAIKGILKGLLQ